MLRLKASVKSPSVSLSPDNATAPAEVRPLLELDDLE